MKKDQEDLTNHYAITMQTHYTVQFKYDNSTWINKKNGNIEYYTSYAEAEAEIYKAFHHKYNLIEEATIFEWKKTPVALKRNNKRSIESTACCYDVEFHYETCSVDLKPLWRVQRSNLYTLEEAKNYIKEQTNRERFRIVKREMTSKYSVVE